MAQVVQGGTIAFNTLLFGMPDQNLIGHLSERLYQGINNLTEQGKTFLQNTAEMFNRFNGEEALRAIRAIGRAATHLWQLDCIRPITTVGDMQFAPPTMIRWIMAEPTLRAMYHKQRVDGYSHFYTDVEPERIGSQHYDYRRATDGLVFINSNDEPDQPEWYAATYFEDLHEGDHDLTLEEKADIQHTWEALRNMLKHGDEDPTSRFCASL